MTITVSNINKDFTRTGIGPTIFMHTS